MKRILTVLLALGAITTVSAQSGRDYGQNRNGSRDVILGQQDNRTVYGNNRSDRNDFYFSERERDQQIRQIRMEYARRIQAVERSRYMRAGERRREIRQLEIRRDQEIRRVNQRFYESRQRGHGNGNYRRF